MFKNSLGALEDSIKKANDSPHMIRYNMVEVYDIVERYLQEKNVIISNPCLLMGKPITQPYTIYCNNALCVANDLANEISKHCIYVFMYTNIKNVNFTITVYNTVVVIIHNIHYKIRDSMYPVIKNKMKIYPPELELINIYHKLYDVYYVSEWDDLRVVEFELYKQIKARIPLITGGGDKKNPVRIVSDMLKWLEGQTEYMLVGESALDYINDNKCHKLQLIGGGVIIGNIKHKLQEISNKKAMCKEHSANIPTLPRLNRTSISVYVNNKYTHIIDVYNASTYENVPYTIYKGLHVGHLEVIFMYVLMNVWNMRVLVTLGICPLSKTSVNIIYSLQKIKKNRKLDPSIFQYEMYLGEHVKVYLQKQNLTNTFYPYIPEQHRYQCGRYRSIHHHQKQPEDQ